MSEGFKLKIWSAQELPENWFKRQQADQKAAKELEENVKVIISKVKAEGDSALIEYAKKFDKAELTRKTLKVQPEEIKEAYSKTSPQQIAAIEFMKQKVFTFQRQLLTQTEVKTNDEGIAIQTKLLPIESVGCYVPGGQASYPSTLVMTAVPAKVAGVPRIVICSPCDAKGKVSPLVLVAADICNVNEIYKVGGAQSIAALAYGTQSVMPVRKIVGPGSKYVTAAKILVSTDVAIDMPAGPSEVLILADESADPRLVAWDMISQAEHGGDSVAGLITTSEKISIEVQMNLQKLAASTARSDKVAESLSKYGFIIVCNGTDEMVTLANQFASEHIEVMTANAKELADNLIGGLILIGTYSPVPLSDYASGTNHVLPTGGFARSFSGLTALDFMRRVSIVECSEKGLERIMENIRVLSEAENLPNHYKTIEARFTK